MVMLGVFSLILQVGGAQLAGRCSSSFLAPGPRKRPVRTLLRSCRGTHPLGYSASPCFAAESTREGTLMSLPEGAPARSGRGVESGYSKYTFGKRGHPLSQRGKAGSSERDIRVPEAKRGRVPCRNEDDNHLSKRSKAEHCLFQRNRASPAEPSTPAFPSGN